MGKYIGVQDDIFSIFGSDTWKTELIKTVPADFTPNKTDGEFIRVNVITSGEGINKNSTSGVLIIDIFTPAGKGPKRAYSIADRLDAYLQEKAIETNEKALTQLKFSSVTPQGVDKDNPTLTRASYTIPFNYFGVL